MSQLNWTYLDNTGKKFQVGLYHGDKSGHLMVYVNSQIVIVDFKVKDSKSYSFYIGAELCELNLHRQATNFEYSLLRNESVDTPLNRARKKQKSKYNIYLIIIAVLFLVLALGIPLMLRYLYS